MTYDMDWIERVRAAKGNTANTNTYDYQRKRTTVAETPDTPRGYVKVEGGHVLASTVIDPKTNIIDPAKVAKQEKHFADFQTRLQAYPGNRAIPQTEPNWRTGQMAAQKWETEPVASSESNTVYQSPVNDYIHILGPKGQVAQYQPYHKRLYAQVGSKQKQTVTYPKWFDTETVEFIENLGGLTSNPFYTGRY